MIGSAGAGRQPLRIENGVVDADVAAPPDEGVPDELTKWIPATLIAVVMSYSSS